MSDSDRRHPESSRLGSKEPNDAVPEDLRSLDADLERLLGDFSDQTPPPGFVDRVFEASVEDLPTRVLSLPREPQPVRIPYLGYAAMLLVAVLASIMILNRSDDDSVAPRLASDAPIEEFEIEEPRESESMLMAVLDPSEDWFEEDDFYGDGFMSGVGAVLQTRGFGVEDLSGDVLAMLGGPAS
jgi:hypothetical protein